MNTYRFSREPHSVKSISTDQRIIGTAIPAPGTAQLLKRLEQVESRSMQGQLPIVWSKASGSSVFDHAGNKWIDFTSTIFVANVGHANQSLVAGLRESLDSELLHTYAYISETRVEYLERLVAFAGAGFEKAFLMSSGTEATEAALKLMRLSGLKKNTRKTGIICIENNWHGRTMGAQLMSSNLDQKKWIGNVGADIYHIPFPYPWSIRTNGADFFKKSIEQLQSQGLDFSASIAGVMLETFQGWGAVFYPTDYVHALKEFCERYDIVLCFDEMQAGFGRTGKNFGYEHYGVSADLLCVGKGMGGGLPLSGVIGKAEILDIPPVGAMSSTHSANPLVCMAGHAVLTELTDNGLTQRSAEIGQKFHARLGEIQNRFSHRISYILGKGMIAAIIFKSDRGLAAEFASAVSEHCYRTGLLVVHTGRESIKLGPPLSISEEALFEGLNVLEEAIYSVDTNNLY